MAICLKMHTLKLKILQKKINYSTNPASLTKTMKKHIHYSLLAKLFASKVDRKDLGAVYKRTMLSQNIGKFPQVAQDPVV